MNKEEILAKSREDNRGADERFRILNQRQSVVMVGAIMLSGVAAMGFWQFYQFRMKFSFVCGLLAAFGAVTFAIKYLLGTM